MPLVQEAYESLPYIDTDPTPAQRTAAQTLIDNETSPSPSPNHPLLPPAPTPHLTPLLTSEFSRIATKTPLGGIDLSRYESLTAPTTPDLASWQKALSTSYTSHEYLRQRTTHLEALNSTGKEEWLAGNEVLVGVLRGVEEELARTKEEIDRVVVERERSQREVEGEIKGMEEGWRRGVGSVVEVEVAAEVLRGRILEARRGGAV